MKCNICGYKGAFLPMGNREQARCPECLSLERHRDSVELIEKYVKKGMSVLHIAPEKSLRMVLNKIGITYKTLDKFRDEVDYKCDLSDIPVDNGTFDFIVCNHVLEHVEDDGKAINEIYRVLKVGGKALISVPIREGKTLEGLTSEEDRLEFYGQADHVRFYGDDFKDRLKGEVKVLKGLFLMEKR